MLASAHHRNRIKAVEIKPSLKQKIRSGAGSLGQDMAEQDARMIPVPSAYPPPDRPKATGRNLNI